MFKGGPASMFGTFCSHGLESGKVQLRLREKWPLEWQVSKLRRREGLCHNPERSRGSGRRGLCGGGSSWEGTPCPLTGGWCAYSLRPEGVTAAPKACVPLVGEDKSDGPPAGRDLGVGASPPSPCQAPGGCPVLSCRPAPVNQTSTAK